MAVRDRRPSTPEPKKVSSEVRRHSPYTVDCAVGRLVEARLFTLRHVDDVAQFKLAMRTAFERAISRAIICADWRRASVLPPDIGEALIDLLRTGNRFFERSAILLPPQAALFNLQVERFVREANHPARRTFRDPRKMQEWLAEVLSPDEILRMAAFFESDR